MGIRQAWHDIRELRREIAELSTPSSEEEEAGYKLAVSATRFSRRSKRVVDDKLNFSATLMRAGEVDAANRLLEEFERDIREEEAALVECVNEVKVATALRRQRVSRLRVVRLMAVALLGACVMSFSALGIAVAGMFHDRENHRVAVKTAERAPRKASVAKSSSSRKSQRSRRSMNALKAAGAKEVLTAHQLETYMLLASSGDHAGLQDFLLSVLPAPLAQKVSTALGVVNDVVPSPSPAAEVSPEKIATHAKKDAAKADADSSGKDAEAQDPAKDEAPPPQNDGQSDDGSTGSDDGGDDGDSDGVLPRGFGQT
jgi:hypothetical protein